MKDLTIIRQFVRARNIQFAMVCSLAAGFSSSAIAQEERIGIDVGNITLFPSLKLEYFSNNNVFLSETDEETNTGIRLSPELLWRAQRRGSTLAVSYAGDFQSSDISQADYTDHRFRLDTRTIFSVRSILDANLDFGRDHLELGESLSRINTDIRDAIVLNRNQIFLRHRYGAEGARGNITTSLRLRSLDFRNNDDITNGLDRTIIAPAIRFSLRVAGSTRAFAEARFTDFDFDDASLDRSETLLGLGVLWDQGGRTSGSVAVGNTQVSGGDDGSTVDINASLFFNPRSFSRFSLSLDRSFDEESIDNLSNTGELQVTNAATLGWNYDWSSRISHSLELQYENLDSECPGNGYTTNRAGFEVDYSVRNWLQFGVGVDAVGEQALCSEPTENVRDFERQSVFLNVKTSL